MTSIPILVSLFAPHPKTLSLSLPESTPVSELPLLLSKYVELPRQTLSTFSGQRIPLDSSEPLSSLRPSNDGPILLRLGVKLCGGKGGFGSQLRAAGGRMSSRGQAENNDSCVFSPQRCQNAELVWLVAQMSRFEWTPVELCQGSRKAQETH